jgi:hypothetical protein
MWGYEQNETRDNKNHPNNQKPEENYEIAHTHLVLALPPIQLGSFDVGIHPVNPADKVAPRMPKVSPGNWPAPLPTNCAPRPTAMVDDDQPNPPTTDSASFPSPTSKGPPLTPLAAGKPITGP